MEHEFRTRMNRQLYEEASEWFVRFRAGDIDAAARRELDRRLRASPEFVRAYLEIAAIWSEASTLDPQRRWDAASLISDATAHDGNVLELADGDFGDLAADRTSQARPRGYTITRRRRMRLAAAGVALAVIVGGAAAFYHSGMSVYETSTGEQRFMNLVDGSTVELNSQSRIEVRYTAAERAVTLVQGEALFHVAKDRSRPFIVSAGGTRVRAVGTEFDVYKKPVATIISVLEGRVEVVSTPAQKAREAAGGAEKISASMGLAARSATDAAAGPVALSAGYRLAVTSAGIGNSIQLDAVAAIAWTRQQLVFDSASVPDIVAEFNRYNTRQMVIEGDLDGLRLSGVFSSTDPMAFVRFLQDRFGVVVYESESEIRVGNKKT
jgi:transmembrane sensor